MSPKDPGLVYYFLVLLGVALIVIWALSVLTPVIGNSISVIQAMQGL